MNAEAKFFDMATYYGLPLISLKAATYHDMLAGKPGFRREPGAEYPEHRACLVLQRFTADPNVTPILTPAAIQVDPHSVETAAIQVDPNLWLLLFSGPHPVPAAAIRLDPQLDCLAIQVDTYVTPAAMPKWTQLWTGCDSSDPNRWLLLFSGHQYGTAAASQLWPNLNYWLLSTVDPNLVISAIRLTPSVTAATSGDRQSVAAAIQVDPNL
eukprot:gene1662-33058_t